MLKQLIDDVRANSKLGNVSLWYYRISGNILECSVHPSYHQNRKEYRSAVISVGQAILSVSKRLEDAGLFSLIQSFPSLEHPELIASIRYFERADADKPTPPRQESVREPTRPVSCIDRLITEAERLELNVQAAPKTFPDSPSKAFEADTDRTLFLLTSKFDNPFYWLKMGYWKENTSHSITEDHAGNVLFKTDFIRFYNGIKQTEDPLQNNYVQAGIYLFGSPEKTCLSFNS